jgi:hypothetical protein
MKFNEFNKKYLALGVLGALAASSAAYAGNTSTITASVKFMTALVVSSTATMDFGDVTKDAGGVYVLTAGSVLTTSGTGEIIGGTPAAASINIVGDDTDTIAISVGSYVASTHVTLSAATCTYGSSTNAGCDSGSPLTGQSAPTSSGATLRVGATATVTSGATADTTEHPTMVVTITYG